MAMCVQSIDITAKSGGNSATVSLRHNELISNLRALVAVRFEQAINCIVLVFGGQVLFDVGTIDLHGITSGVTVHVVLKQQPQLAAAAMSSDNSSSSSTTKKTSSESSYRNLINKSVELFKSLLEDRDTLRDVLQNDPRIKALVEENSSFRHYLNSDRNIDELLSTVCNPAKVEELLRKRDLYVLRMEWVPGGYSLLSRLNYYMRQLYEDNVALKYQETDDLFYHNEDPQRGRENNMPLPNPWCPEQLLMEKLLGANVEEILADVRKQCDHMMHCLRTGDVSNALKQAETKRWQLKTYVHSKRSQLKLKFKPVTEAVLSALCKPQAQAQSPAQPAAVAPVALQAEPQPILTRSMPLNPFDFMSSNDTRWEQHFQTQLLHLSALGHTDRQRNICALLMSFGNIQTAVKLLEQWNR
ncbi:CG31528 [Drosophila busckii]|uniref:CG31528 n=1 Tax=Drosophila busckii TaxID=30019 RepID=A0A0M4EGJ0_DROBS|nr:CG31528 [Drosophila busckii]